MNSPTKDNLSAFSIPRLLEVILSAAIVGGIAVYASQEVNKEKLKSLTAIAEKNTETLDRLEDTLFNMRVQMVKTESNSVVISAIKDSIALQDARIRQIENTLNKLEGKYSTEEN